MDITSLIIGVQIKLMFVGPSGKINLIESDVLGHMDSIPSGAVLDRFIERCNRYYRGDRFRFFIKVYNTTIIFTSMVMKKKNMEKIG